MGPGQRGSSAGDRAGTSTCAYYEPTIDLLRGLGNLYNDDPDFNRTISQFHPDLPAFMREAINIYCDRLEAEQQS